MKRRQKVRVNKRRGQPAPQPGGGKATAARAGATPDKRQGWGLRTSAKPQFYSMKITDFYRPLKRPVTLRLDADVIAWFRKDGRRYQTRINAALRRVMEREMKA